MSRPFVDTHFFRVAVIGALSSFIAACDHDVAPEPLAPRVAVLSGNDQQARDGSRLSEPLAVRVTGTGGSPMPGVEVVWRVTQGSGEFHNYPDDQLITSASSFTDGDGIARVFFFPQVLGGSLITASAVGVAASPAQFFATDKPQFEILFGPVFDCTPFTDTSSFSLDHLPQLVAPVNATVSLGYYPGLDGSCTARIRTTSVPDGAEPFDTGILYTGEAFVFKPRVAGTWEFTDVINGGTGRLIVH